VTIPSQEGMTFNRTSLLGSTNEENLKSKKIERNYVFGKPKTILELKVVHN
jgi:hypothetical protein